MFKTLLLPVDLSSPQSWENALPAALRLGNSDCALHIVTVVPDFGLSVVGSFFEEGFEKRALHEVGEKLTAWVQAHVPEGVDVHPHVMHGRVYDEIIRAADRLDVDAIVLGSHRPDIADYLLGPNAARVVRHAKQSVFVVRGDG
ncbi:MULTISPECIES: universal stress protein [unclassified Dinoroseobacter]|uniref:universal stress protein n=1 Tax=unclassified Dinoroseobacter TaxID=2620028 RepID=UPI003C7EDA24